MIACADFELREPAKFCRPRQPICIVLPEGSLTTAMTASGVTISFRSRQNDWVYKCAGTLPPEKQSWTTTSNCSEVDKGELLEASVSSEPLLRVTLRLCTQVFASWRTSLSGGGAGSPKNRLAASYTAGSISTRVVSIPCRMKEVAAIPVPRPLSQIVSSALDQAPG